MTVAEFSLRDLVREVAGQSSAADPTDLAAEVLARIPRGAVKAALEEALRGFVRDFVRVERNTTGPATQPPVQRSARVAGVSDAWKQFLASRISVDGRWIFLADATADDLVQAAAERRALAEQNLAKAAEFERLAEAMRAQRVQRLGDLDAEAVRAA